MLMAIDDKLVGGFNHLENYDSMGKWTIKTV
jgi:hypothetical protein